MAYSLENTQNLTNLADAIRAKTGGSSSLTVPQMTDAVGGLAVLPNKNMSVYNSSSYAVWLKSLLFNFPQLLTAIKQFDLYDTGSINGLFSNVDNSDLIALPKIVLYNNTTYNFNTWFTNNNWLQYINIEFGGANNTSFSVQNFASMFDSCLCLKEIDVSFFEHCSSVTNMRNTAMFNGCNRLRTITGLQYLPIITYTTPISQSTNSIYQNMFYNCYSLNSIENLVVEQITYSVNTFSNAFTGNYQLKKMTFKTNNGVADTANWSNQAIDLRNNGYWNNVWAPATNYGFSAEKEITDSTSYNLLKNDPDAWTRDVNYSRYNHTSAVETINSLPDVSQGSNNTISFTGASGTYTDGGPISDLTQAEIAVATNKGWTVSIV